MRKVGLLVVVCWWLVACGMGDVVETPEPAVPSVIEGTTMPFTTLQPSLVPTQTQRTPKPVPTGIGVSTNTPRPTLTPTITPESADFPLLGVLGRGYIEDVMWSPDGKLLAVGSSVGIYLLDANTLEEVRFIETGAAVRNLLFYAGGKEIVVGAKNWIKFWDVQSGELLRGINVPLSGDMDVSRVMISPDGSLMAASISTYQCDIGGDVYIFVWNLTTGNLLSQAEGLSVSSDNSRQMGVSQTRLADWKLNNNTLLLNDDFSQHENAQSLSFDGRILLAYSSNSPIRLFEVETGRLLYSIDLSEAGTVVNAYLVGSNQILVVEVGDRVVYYDLKVGEIFWEFSYEEWQANPFVIHPDGKKYLEIRDAVIELKDIQTDAVLASTGGFSEGLEFLTFSPDGQLLGGGQDNGDVILWDLNTKEHIVLKRTEEEYYSLPKAIVIDPMNLFLAVMDYDQSVVVWDVSTKEQVQQFTFSANVVNMGFSESQEFFVLERGNQWWKVWKWAYGQSLENPLEEAVLDQLDLSLFSALSADEKANFQVRTVNDLYSKAFLIFWNPNTISSVFAQEFKYLPEFEAAFDVHSNLLFTNSSEVFGVDIWNLAQVKVVKSIGFGEGEAYRIRFQPSGNLLIWSQYNVYCGLDEQIVLIYNLETEQVYSLHTDHTGNVYGLDISPDGRILATGSADGTIRLWQLP